MTQLAQFIRRLPVGGFLPAMLATVALALLYPAPGASGGPLALDRVTTAGVALLFMLSGIGLSTEKLKAGARNWRLHLLVQSGTYVLFPLVGLLIGVLARPLLPQQLLVGFFFLCALPSTISTSIAMTALARGNVAGALFNATLSALLGVVITPVLVGLWLHTRGQGAPLGGPLLAIAEQLLLPFLAGQLLRPWLADRIARHRTIASMVDRGVILLIIYNTFCDSTQAGLWHNFSAAELLQALLLVAALLALALSLTTLAARRCGFSTEDEIAAVFCGSKKSLATGVPMARLLFSGGSLGLIVLPVMFYHPLQLLVCTVLARRYAARPLPADAAADPGRA